ncbi:MAG: tRNA(His) guanylyltransferase Thg1 family protein [Euryarchaeota archaeon]|nr:tRNA(His) guanylyltransferase Thg1 family protein [Euryarchaeota archaeon]
MKNREIFSSLFMVSPVIVRLDGRAFHSFTRSMDFKKPFDEKFCCAMSGVCKRILRDSGLEPLFAYTFSDEISLYFNTLPFNGRVEKIDSVCASFAASALMAELDLREPVSFDARVVCITPDLVCDYLVWRQKEAWRNHMNAYCQQALISEGLSHSGAAKKLKGIGSVAMHEMMFERGINLAKTPAWQRRGVVAFRKKIIKEGYNPIKKETVEAERKVVSIDTDLPLFNSPQGVEYIHSLTSGT